MEKRDKYLIVKVTDAEREAIRRAARARGLTMSALTRYVLIAGLQRVEVTADGGAGGERK